MPCWLELGQCGRWVLRVAGGWLCLLAHQQHTPTQRFKRRLQALHRVRCLDERELGELEAELADVVAAELTLVRKGGCGCTNNNNRTDSHSPTQVDKALWSHADDLIAEISQVAPKYAYKSPTPQQRTYKSSSEAESDSEFSPVKAVPRRRRRLRRKSSKLALRLAREAEAAEEEEAGHERLAWSSTSSPSLSSLSDAATTPAGQARRLAWFEATPG